LIAGWCSPSFHRQEEHAIGKGELCCFFVLGTHFSLQLMEAFCRHQSFDLRSIRFMFEGNSVSSSSTPAGLGMEDGDEIDAFLSQVGGEHERRHDE
jgi:hypothetical protein